jgi:hypothetical protein
MHAPRYRLRFITGVTLSAATYGSGTYGSGTYGEQASDPLSSLLYYLVPWPGGYLADPSWIYRQGDIHPQFKAVVRSIEDTLDLTSLARADLVLTNTDGGADLTPWLFPLTVALIDGISWLVRDWAPGDLDTPGTYRTGVVLTFNSGRRMTVPTDDRLNFQITPTA